ncbi:MAG: tripartite tricarboxylate transporter substrate binding protein [Burkholderiales bacterium]|nr:tripartite tricarboxylate transporter substrate binding protein [Burkholderiales bacterium]MDP2400097.1 tripartite tricarboxylate transporter substrate binding protein [Burkholderiales bacterium]
MKRLLIAAACASVSLAAQAQTFPNKAMTVVVPNPPGGMNQIHAQPLSAVIERLTKQPAPVVNRAGGTAAVGTAFVANQPADGHTLLVTTPNIYLVIEKDKLYGIKSPYTLAQIQPVALLSADPLILTVHPTVPAKTVKEFIALAKAAKGSSTFSSSGPYGITHVPMEMFLDAAGLKMRHVPTTGGGPAITQLLGGHVDATDGGVAAVFPHVKSGKMRALASWGAKRHPSLPEVPTFKELGIDIEAYLWVGVFTAAGIPDATLTQLRDLIRKVAADPSFAETLAKVQVVPDYRDTPEFKTFFDADYKRMARAVQRIGKL